MIAAEVRRIVTSVYYPLWIAASNGRTGIVERLLRVEGVDVNRGRRDNGATPLYMACQNGHEAVVERLLAHDAIDVNQATTDKVTPLNIAADEGCVRIVELLLSRSADTSVVDKWGDTARRAAEGKGHTGIAAMIEKAEEEAAVRSRDGGESAAE